MPVLKKILVEIKNPNKKQYVLDIGCGSGGFCNFLHSLSFEVVGLDNSMSGIDIARTNLPNIRFYNNSIYDFDEPDLYGKFDIVTSMGVIEHLTNPRELLRQAKRYLNPNGYFLVATQYHGYLKNLILSALNLWDWHFSVDWDTGHVKFFSVKSLKNLLKAQGFTNLKFFFSGRCPCLWKDMICLCQPSL